MNVKSILRQSPQREADDDSGDLIAVQQKLLEGSIVVFREGAPFAILFP